MEKKTKKPKTKLKFIAVSPELHKQLSVLKKTGRHHNMTETIKSLIIGG
jgi:hypothetical protein